MENSNFFVNSNLSSVHRKDSSWFSQGINMIDCDNEFCEVAMADHLDSKESMVGSIKNFFRQMFTDSSVTDVSLCIFMQTSFVESETTGWIYQTFVDNVAKFGEEHFRNVSPREMWHIPIYPQLYHKLKQYHLDWAQLAMDTCKEAGVRPWIYFRMNDLHFNHYERSFLRDPFWYQAKENGWLMGTSEYDPCMGFSGRAECAYNYAHKEVREWMLRYIEEMVLRYDAFGFELDFERNINCFNYLHDTGYQEYMNDFIRKVHKIIKKGEDKHGHDIKLMVRLAHTIEDNYTYGFDVATWVKEGLVDALVPSCEEVINSEMDIAAWRKIVGNDVALLVGFDDHVIRLSHQEANSRYRARKNQVKGFYANYISKGADGCYFNNYYRDMGALAKGLNKESVMEGLRTLLVTHQDNAPIGRQAYHPLPLAIHGKGNVGTDFPLNIGLIRTEEYVYLTVGYSSSDEEEAVALLPDEVNTEVTLAGQSPVAVEQREIQEQDVAGCYYQFKDRRALFRKSHILLRYQFKNISTDGEITVHFTNNDQTCLVVYLDLTVTPEELD